MLDGSWHEHDPFDLLDSVHECIEGTIEEIEAMGYSRDDVKGIGITNQRETTLLWDRRTGQPCCNAIVWDDSRTTGVLHRFQKKLETEGIILEGSDLDLDLEGVVEDGGVKKLMGAQGIKEL